LGSFQVGIGLGLSFPHRSPIGEILISNNHGDGYHAAIAVACLSPELLNIVTGRLYLYCITLKGMIHDVVDVDEVELEPIQTNRRSPATNVVKFYRHRSMFNECFMSA